ncbi:MAG: 3-deoxy-7-phosphoheptulonate synthase [Candidatus Aegiribacteria sp.]|nr:3-deoxy-7-phosphoheptulonate synthase [Candidatus Aegiribacteria sp.]MBD3295299.1 3-deoxy-7-phosphoheptulonate synthase [Candidatus Fermentibacteria bacterium]
MDVRSVEVGNVRIGVGDAVLIAGPCSVENLEMLREVAAAAVKAGVSILRGGSFKPRTSPYSFQGLGLEGFELLHRVGSEYNIPVVSEVMSIEQIEPSLEHIDMIQVGARNMHNFPLLAALGRTDKPVLLKRGFMATIEEWLMAAEYIVKEGNDRVVLCERGIRTFEPWTRNTLDISAVPLARMLGGYPVIVDPCHASGRRDLLQPLAMASIAAGADGIMLEAHPDPDKALSDGGQSLAIPELMELAGMLLRRIKSDSS